MKLLTIFTTTYNRAYTLPNLYKSLCNQTNKDFKWLIIDDGSKDNTKELVSLWIEESIIEIQYIYQENQGMHGGHNTAYANIDTEWNTCIDSDDYMPNNGVEIILNNLKDLDDKYAGIAGLDIDKDGQVIGTKFPERLKESTLSDIYFKYKVKGDKKLVYRTAIVKKYPPYPIFKDENFVPLSYLYYLIDQDYLLKPINFPLVVVEYQQDGSTRNMLKQYRDNPKGFTFARINSFKLGLGFKENFKNSIHVVSSTLFTRDYQKLIAVRHPLLIFASLPFGILLNIYIRIKTRKK